MTTPAPPQPAGGLGLTQNGNTTPSSPSPSVPSSNLPNGTAPSSSRLASSDSRNSVPPVATAPHGVPGAMPTPAMPSPQFPPPGPMASTPANRGSSNGTHLPPQNMTYNGPYSHPPPPPAADARYVSPSQPHPQLPPPQHYQAVPQQPRQQQPHAPVVAEQAPIPNGTSTSGRPSAPPIQESTNYRDLSHLLSISSPDIVRQVIRDHWEKAILGSQYHLAFLLNATIHQANDETLVRAVKDFGSRMIRVSKEHVVQHLGAEDLDLIADLLLTQASPTFLDKALARRLETIPARQLVNALARAERLGYDVQDIVEEGQGGGEHVIPSLHSLAVPPQPQPVPSQAHPATMHAPLPSQSLPQVPPAVKTKRTPGPSGLRRSPSLKGPGMVEYCNCGWPCSSIKALEYHGKKHACGAVLSTDQVGKELCPHCGCRFTSPGGLYYHNKVNVCGAYTEQQLQLITSLIHEFRKNKAAHPATTAPPTPTPVPTPSRPLELPPGYATPSDQGTPPPGRAAYAHLPPDKKQELDAEMRKTEDYYGGLMREAMSLPEPEKSKQLAALKNRYNTKQSVTRKKYGIRLRERRSRAEINAERIRLFGTLDGPSLSGHDSGTPPLKKARVDDAGASTTMMQPSDSQANTPRKRVPVRDMGGLSGSQATAEMNDPTASLNPVQPRQVLAPSGTQDDPMSIDDESDDESDDTASDEDIPATVPRIQS
ncbi:hypothetical protein B0T10DRAFT_117123 [Thelonectria olida]|uniref:Uncharacterized protein n=1 Tax=Thelonectria olida TaxID=1576542 RepID=A0A9P8WGR5_9HYPO|nr:hypothetical protein B0T10DRAFT_117123 [Thelonectria olida]